MFLLVVEFLLPATLLAQDPNVCDEPGEKPDVIVGDLFMTLRHGLVGDVTAFSLGTFACNIGSCWLCCRNLDKKR